MELKNLINRCSDALQEEVNDGSWDETSYTTCIETEGGYINLYLTKIKGNWVYEVEIEHKHDLDRFSSNLEEFLAEQIDGSIDWSVAEEEWRDADLDEWEYNGFRDEADFWRWKEG